jgi:hypothetical protein
LKSHKDMNIEKMKQKYRHGYNPHRQYRRSNLKKISNILQFALTGAVNRNKAIHKAIAHKISQAYGQLSNYLEIMIAKGLLDMDRTE